MRFSKLFFLLGIFILLGSFASAEILINDTFDRSDSSTIGNGWIEYGAGANDNADIYSNTLRIVDTYQDPELGGVAVYRDNFNIDNTKSYILKYKYKRNSGGTSNSLFSGIINDAIAPAKYARFYHSVGGTLTWQSNNHSVTNFVTLTDGVWYDIALEIDFFNNRAKIIVNETEYGYYTFESGSYTDIQVMASGSTSTYNAQIDNFLFCEESCSVSNNFSISAKSFWDNSSISTFNATINGTTYTTTNDTITTDILENSTSLYNINISSGDWFNTTYTDYNVSNNLESILIQTDITFNFLFNNNDIITTPINFTRLDNNISTIVYNGTINIFPNEGIQNFNVKCDNNVFAPFNISLNFTALENSTYNYTVNETPTYLYFYDANNSNPIINASVYVTFPSGYENTYVTNSYGYINFSYIQNDIVEFGQYNFSFSGLGYTLYNFSETINSSNIPFNQSYNMSRAKITVYIYDRETGSLLLENVSIVMLGLFNDNTNTGIYIKDNLTVTSGEYTIYASSTGYKTETRTFTYTNQEELEIFLYLLKINVSNLGVLTVNSVDSFYQKITGANIELLEYSPSSDSFISVSQCISNIDAQCFFNMETNTKIYLITGTKISGGELLSASTGSNGEIFTNSVETRNLVFYTVTDFSVDIATRLVYSISESFVNNISSISTSFYSIDGISYTVCIEYFKNDVSVTGSTYCLTSTSALQNINTGITLNRSNDYRADIYIEQSGYNLMLGTYNYPSDKGIEGVFNKDIIGAVIVVAWVFALALSVFSKNMVLWFILALVLSWVQLLIFPLNSIISFAVFKTLISIVGFMVGRKKRDFQ